MLTKYPRCYGFVACAMIPMSCNASPLTAECTCKSALYQVEGGGSAPAATGRTTTTANAANAVSNTRQPRRQANEQRIRQC